MQYDDEGKHKTDHIHQAIPPDLDRTEVHQYWIYVGISHNALILIGKEGKSRERHKGYPKGRTPIRHHLVDGFAHSL
jgi:hypothetical protein